MSDWLDSDLAQHLRPVEAPADLWSRVAPPRAEDRKRGFRLAPFLAVAAAVAALMIAAPSTPSIRTSDPAELNRWMRTTAAIDLPVPDKAAGRIRGARLVERNGVPCTEVGFRAGYRSSSVLIARAGMTHEGHWHKHNGYMLQSADPAAACGLCHADL
jgi:hypothetical protein